MSVDFAFLPRRNSVADAYSSFPSWPSQDASSTRETTLVSVLELDPHGAPPGQSRRRRVSSLQRSELTFSLSLASCHLQIPLVSLEEISFSSDSLPTVASLLEFLESVRFFVPFLASLLSFQQLTLDVPFSYFRRVRHHHDRRRNSRHPHPTWTRTLLDVPISERSLPLRLSSFLRPLRPWSGN